MRILTRFLSPLVVVLLCAATLSGQGIPSKYYPYDEMTKAIKTLASAHSDIVKLESIGKTLKGRDIWALAIRKGNPDDDRAMLVVGGTEAVQIAGSELALRYAEHLVNSFGKDEKITKLLQSTTVYIIPRVTPDATEAYFAKPLAERSTNYRSYDDDRDGATDEDDVDDVNKDGFITMMRVKDSRGEWMLYPDDPRLMKKADQTKGEKGEYLLYTEGIDNDKDDEWNEDGVGGVDFNKNFPFNYQFFETDAGIYQVSEAESRSIAQFIFSKPNIAAVFSFSSTDNLTTPWRTGSGAQIAAPTATAGTEGRTGRGGGGTGGGGGTRGGGGGGGGGTEMFTQRGSAPTTPTTTTQSQASRGVTSVLTDDAPYYDYISKQFLDLTKLSEAPAAKKASGNFTEWVYYHTGRWSFSVRPWWAPPDRGARRDTTSGGGMASRMRQMGRTGGFQTGQASLQEQQVPDDAADQLRVLRWYEANGYKDVFVPWTKVKHPDFPDRDVEVGGIKPYVLANPPADSLNSFSQPYNKFLTYLAGQLPTVGLKNIKVEKVNESVYRLSLDVVNAGYLPTNSAIGVRARWPRNVYLTLDLAKDQSLANGRAKQRLSPIKGSGGYSTTTWLIVGKPGSTVKVTAESPMTGEVTETITLR
ncbi:MAG: M14 family metallopeptidase [bacterium]